MAIQNGLKATLEWYEDQGIDHFMQDTPRNYFEEAKKPAMPVTETISQTAPPPPVSQNKDIDLSHIDTLEGLREAIANYDGFAIKRTATNLVFSDGNPESDIMLIGEAPGGDDDRTGKPFSGDAGALLDKMFACIDLTRESLYITNIINWRPPGNRTPSPEEIDLAKPFIEKHIALIKPKLIIAVGGVCAKALLNTEDGVSKLRGKEHIYNNTPLIVTYHPSYLINSPGQKRAAWMDLLNIKDRLAELS